MQGIRSFALNHAEAIQFNTPLTLIVGFNGSGKTAGRLLPRGNGTRLTLMNAIDHN